MEPDNDKLGIACFEIDWIVLQKTIFCFYGRIGFYKSKQLIAFMSW